MVDRNRYLELGGFDPLYHPLYYEEIDLSYRALKRGWEVRYEPESIAYHKVQSTITRQKKRRQIGWISARNNYLFVWKNILDSGMTLSFMFYIPLFLIKDLFKMKFRFWIATRTHRLLMANAALFTHRLLHGTMYLESPVSGRLWIYISVHPK